jgi:hypothetical protein
MIPDPKFQMMFLLYSMSFFYCSIYYPWFVIVVLTLTVLAGILEGDGE